MTKHGQSYRVDINDEGTELIAKSRYRLYDGSSNIQLFAYAA